MKTSGLIKILALCVGLVSCGPESNNAVPLSADADGFAGGTLSANYSKSNPAQSVVLISRRDDESASFCGGLLIARNKILTARHCAVSESNARYLTVFFPKGEKATSTSTSFFASTKSAEVRRVVFPDGKKILPNVNVNQDAKDWNTAVFIFDAAVLELATNAPDFVPVFDSKNMATDEDLRGGRLSAFGWDSDVIEFNGSNNYSEIVRRENKSLRISDKSLLDRFFAGQDLKTYCQGRTDKCSFEQSAMPMLYGRSAQSIKLLTTSPHPNCQGDSGSPLFVITKEGKYKLLGVTSSGLGINGKLVDRSLTGIMVCSAHTFYQTVLPLKAWLQQVGN